MGRRKKGHDLHGWVNLYKPKGMTSTQAVGALRRILNPNKIGHAGTLDPLAEGILPIACGEATKTIPYAQDHLKDYEFDVIWGEQRNTDDAEGDIIADSENRPDEQDIINALPQFTGHIEQTPPAFSAIHVNGQRAYDLARKGLDVKLQPRPVYIQSLELLSCNQDNAKLYTTCGKGTYIRSLARDLALALGTVGYVSYLKRCRVGPFSEKSAIFLDELEKKVQSGAPLSDQLLPVTTVLDDIPALALTEQDAQRLRNGQTIKSANYDDQIKGAQNTALALLQDNPVAIVEKGQLDIRSLRVFNL